VKKSARGGGGGEKKELCAAGWSNSPMEEFGCTAVCFLRARENWRRVRNKEKRKARTTRVSATRSLFTQANNRQDSDCIPNGITAEERGWETEREPAVMGGVNSSIPSRGLGQRKREPAKRLQIEKERSHFKRHARVTHLLNQ